MTLGPLEDLLASDRYSAAELRDKLLLAQRNGVRLLRLVNALLDFSRIEAGRIRASYEPTDLAAFSAEIASSFRSAIETAGMRLRVTAVSVGTSPDGRYAQVAVADTGIGIARDSHPVRPCASTS